MAMAMAMAVTIILEVMARVRMAGNEMVKRITGTNEVNDQRQMRRTPVRVIPITVMPKKPT